ncbi:uncharacterized protein A4U43_C07F4990 [Asparagus officinalis]|uniref:Uncharacterized protein n=1 Tax=Asparagus officinalis TaxID=4686 RepID=A0A5P1E9F6_ASPOF|nr:uncharacterized protein A4U43_C07F4990 [Asparagus officinalis]
MYSAGPYAWVQYVPGEPIPRSRPNKGSVKGRKENKRIAQRKAFILSEKKKRKAQFAESKKKKAMERIERKMAAVAREKAWAERLKELQKLEEEKKAVAREKAWAERLKELQKLEEEKKAAMA